MSKIGRHTTKESFLFSGSDSMQKQDQATGAKSKLMKLILRHT